MAFYLKYRPQTIDDLDLISVRESLTTILSSNILPHALLFAGPKGTGKTSAARIFAKIINCTKKKKDNLAPCNKCDSCSAITKGYHVDIIEMDAASNRGIDDIRSLREAIRLAPASAKYKVYIIDEAHMLTTEASNALLKTLEEPPEHVIFILATTNPEKLISTIRSRTTLISFPKATIEEIVLSLQKKVKGENLSLEKGVLQQIASVSDGAFRDADKILEQLSLESSEITVGNLKKLSLGGDAVDTEKLLALLFDNDTKAALELIDKIVRNGGSIFSFIDKLLDKSRHLLLSGYGLGEDGGEESSFPKEKLMILIDNLIEAHRQIPNSYLDQIPLELVVIRMSKEGSSGDKKKDNTVTLSNGFSKVSSEEIKASTNGDSVLTKKVSINVANNASDRNLLDSNNVRVDLQKSRNTGDHSDVVNILTNGVPSSRSIGDNLWKEILHSVREKNASTEALLRASHPIDYDGKNLKIGVYYSFHKQHLESHNHRELLESVCESILGNAVVIECLLTKAPAISQQAPSTVAEQVSKPVAEEPSNAMNNSALTDADNEDIMNMAKEIFGT